MKPLVDSHCHLDLLAAHQRPIDVDVAVNGARADGIVHILCVAVSCSKVRDVLAIADRYDGVSASVGIHPTSTEEEESDASPETLTKLANHPKVVAIGETGLDFYYGPDDRSGQIKRFRRHIRAARMTNLPLIVHTRDARDDTMRILREEGAADVGGVMHCFTESWEMAKTALDLGFYISFSGIVTFRNASELRDIARRIPRDRLLVETDSPYLAPVPHRGKTNRPQWVRCVADFVAELRGEQRDEFAVRTTANFFKCFPRAKQPDGLPF